jgi:Family of unknown function (DUF6941)
MHVQLALVCDEARMRPDGKMDVEGVFNDLAAPGFPATQDRMVLVTTIEWDRGDSGRNKFRVDLVAPDGRPSLTVDGHTDVVPRPPDRPPPRTRLILPLENVVFPRAGRYSFEIRIKGKRMRGPSLFVMEGEVGEGADEDPRAPGQEEASAPPPA